MHREREREIEREREMLFFREFDDRMSKSPPGAGYSDNSDDCRLHFICIDVCIYIYIYR